MSRFFSYLALILALTGVPGEAFANLNQQMDSMFNSMANVTNPQAYKGQRMGVFSGGSVVVRNRIVNSNIVGFIPPNISAGCGGIDMFGGSFSFINAKQLVNTFRAIASNAQGYFFQLALQAMCPSCSGLISSFQKKVQQLNQLASNSCTTAKAGIDALAMQIPKGLSPGPFQRMRDLATADMASNGVAFTDFFSAFHPSDKKNPLPKIEAAKPGWLLKKGYTGNIAWDVMQHSMVKGWIKFGDNDLLETMMSLTGTIIYTKPNKTVSNVGGSKDKTSVRKVLPPTLNNILTFIDSYNLKKGQAVEIYRCAPDYIYCLHPVKTATPNFKDLQTRIEDILIGPNGMTGIVAKYEHPQLADKLSQKEKAFVQVLGDPMIAQIRTLAQTGTETAKIFVLRMAPYLARKMAIIFVRSLITAMTRAADQATPEMQPRIAGFKKMIQIASKNLYNMANLRAKDTNNDFRFFQTLRNEGVNGKSLTQIIDKTVGQ